MFMLKDYFADRKTQKENWDRIKANSEQVLESYNEDYRHYAEALKDKIIEKKVLYESVKGDRMEGRAFELFRAFQARPDFNEYEHVWIVRKKKEYKAYIKEYKEFENVKFLLVEESLEEYLKALATSAYLFQEGVFPTCFVKRGEQMYIKIQNTDHEVMQGYLEEEGNYRMSNRMHNLLQADFLIVKEDRDVQILRQNFKLEGCYKGKIITADTTQDGTGILKTILENKQSVKIMDGLLTDKKKMLIYGGGMAMNGVTEALLALLKRLDYNTNDVTVMCWLQDGTYSRGNVNRVDSRARVLLFKGADPMTREEQLQILYLKDYGLSDAKALDIYNESRYLLKRAAMRRLGNTSYDIIIDFSGYAAWIPLLLLEVPAKKRLIWEHADMKEDFNIKNSRDAAGKTVQLEGLLSIYEKFDAVVAVNEVLMKLNREKIGIPETEVKFRYATNLMDTQWLAQKFAKIEEEAYLTDCSGKKYIVFDSASASLNGTIRMIPFEREKGAFRFVTMGRLSQEKNHENLILAFRKFLKSYPGSQLFIIGKGVLREELEGLIIKNKLEKNIILTGNLKNPYLLMKNCDCFIFPSLYEGQGLVVLEARMLKMPIVMSSYDAAIAVCVENGQLMMGTEPDEILQGFKGFAEGNVPVDYTFDAEAYNAKALEEFCKLLED